MEWEWNKQRAVDDAKDWAKMDMEKKFAIEREQIKNEFLGNIESLMKWDTFCLFEIYLMECIRFLLKLDQIPWWTTALMTVLYKKNK